MKTIEQVTEAVAFHFKMEPAELLSPRRTEEIAWPRMLAMSICAEEGHLQSDIDLAFLHKHGAAYHAVGAVRDRITMPKYLADYRLAKGRLNR